MKNIALCLRYDGSRYHGWQVQKNDITVAQTLEEALAEEVQPTVIAEHLGAAWEDA